MRNKDIREYLMDDDVESLVLGLLPFIDNIARDAEEASDMIMLIYKKLEDVEALLSHPNIMGYFVKSLWGSGYTTRCHRSVVHIPYARYVAGERYSYLTELDTVEALGHDEHSMDDLVEKLLGLCSHKHDRRIIELRMSGMDDTGIAMEIGCSQQTVNLRRQELYKAFRRER